MAGIELIADRIAGRRRFGWQLAVTVQVIRRGARSSEGPFLLVAPMSAHEYSAFRGLMGITPSHHVNPHRGFTIDAVVDVLQPTVEPTALEFPHLESRIGGELGVPRVAGGGSAVLPRSYDELLEAVFVLAQADIVEICVLRRRSCCRASL